MDSLYYVVKNYLYEYNMGIDTSKEFSVNGMRYHKDENGWYESEANRAAQETYERLTANNRTYLLADERTKKKAIVTLNCEQ